MALAFARATSVDWSFRLPGDVATDERGWKRFSLDRDARAGALQVLGDLGCRW